MAKKSPVIHSPTFNAISRAANKDINMCNVALDMLLAASYSPGLVCELVERPKSNNIRQMAQESIGKTLLS